VSPDDGLTEETLRAAVPGATWTRCPSLDAAEVYLSAAEFDAVVVDEALVRAEGRDPRERLGTPVHVVRAGDAAGLRAALGAGAAGPEALLREVPMALGRAVHDANNPLTVITGNAQYALEMARALNVDASLIRSIEDIEEAGRRLEAALGVLSDLRRRLAGALDAADGAVGGGTA